jgi:hypothetical protein
MDIPYRSERKDRALNDSQSSPQPGSSDRVFEDLEGWDRQHLLSRQISAMNAGPEVIHRPAEIEPSFRHCGINLKGPFE